MKKLKEAIRNIVKEESEYQTFFKKALEKSGKSISQMSDDEKKAFFNKIDAAWDGKGEKNEELVGNQHKLDVDGDGEIEASDLAALRAGKKVDEAVDFKDGKYRFYSKDGVAYLTYDGKVLSDGDYDFEGGNSYWMSHSSWKGQKAFDNGKDVIKYFKSKKITTEAVNEEDDADKVWVVTKNKGQAYQISKKAYNVNKDRYILAGNRIQAGVYAKQIRDKKKVESVNENFSPSDVEKIKKAVQNSASFMQIGRGLQQLGFKYSFGTSPYPIYMIKKGTKTYVLINKKYADDPEFVIGDTAGGLLEGVVTEGKFKSGDSVLISHPTMTKPVKGVVSMVVNASGNEVLVLKGDGGVWDSKFAKLNEGNAFGAAVTAAKKEGKKEFEFNGKKYKVKKGSYEKNESAKKLAEKTQSVTKK